VSNARLKSWGNLSLKELFPMSDDEKHEDTEGTSSGQEELPSLDHALAITRARPTVPTLTAAQPSQPTSSAQLNVESGDDDMIAPLSDDQEFNQLLDIDYETAGGGSAPAPASTFNDEEIDQLEGDSDFEISGQLGNALPAAAFRKTPALLSQDDDIEHYSHLAAQSSQDDATNKTTRGPGPLATSPVLAEEPSRLSTGVHHASGAQSSQPKDVEAAKVSVPNVPGYEASPEEQGAEEVAMNEDQEEDEFEKWLRDSVIIV
jgi:hypothetical protein